MVCTLAPHHAREEHANAQTGWRWHDEPSSPHPLSVTTHPGRAGISRPAGYPAAARFPQPGERRHRMPGRKQSHHMTTIVPGHRTAAGRPLSHDDHGRRRANQLRTRR